MSNDNEYKVAITENENNEWFFHFLQGSGLELEVSTQFSELIHWILLIPMIDSVNRFNMSHLGES